VKLKRIIFVWLVILVAPLLVNANQLGKNGVHFHINLANPLQGPEYTDTIDSGTGVGISFFHSLGHCFYLSSGFDYYNFGESNLYYNDGYYRYNYKEFNFHLLNFSAGLRYILKHDFAVIPFLEMEPGIYINRKGKNNPDIDYYESGTSAGLNFGGGIILPFYRGGVFEFGALYNINFFGESDLHFFSFTGGISYFFKGNANKTNGLAE